VRRLLTLTALGTALALTVIPLAWLMLTSLKSNPEITQDATLLPDAPSFANYERLFSERDFGLYLRNSLVVTTISVALALTIGSLAAYAIARFRLPFRLERKLGLGFLVARIVPTIVVVAPIYLIILELDLLNTLLGLILVYTAFDAAFVVWMMESFFREIPRELEEAALVDGDSRLGALVRVVVPAAAPGLVATAIFATVVTFNEFLFALALTVTPDAETVPRGTASLVTRLNTDWGAMAAAGVVSAAPIVAFALIVQRHLVRGLTLGAVK
jgi:multiple sugar transport system permease protein